MKITPRTRRASAVADLPHAALQARLIRAVLADGSWRQLLPLPLDGLVLVPSRSTAYANHEVSLAGRHIQRCSGPCGAHPTCFHRVAAALASWQTEHPGWDLTAICDPATGAPATAALTALIREYLTPQRASGRRLGPGALRDDGLPEGRSLSA